jgi:uncharacterized repeat protein (TIGR02543 family)
MRALKTVLFIVAVCAAGILLSTLNSRRDVVSQLNSPQIPAKMAGFVADPVVSAPPPAVSSPSAAPIIPEKIPLITGGAENDVSWISRTPAARRVRRIFPDEKLMSPEPVLKKGDRIELALFDDAVLDAEISNVTRYPNGAVGLTAHLRNGREGTLFLSYCGGQMRASVKMIGGADFYVKYNPETWAHYAVEVDRENSIVLEGAEPLIPPADDVAAADVFAPVAAPDPVVLADAPAGSTIVDVMVVYTPAALAYEGNTANMNANIALAMQRANEAHTNSNTQVYLNLIHSAEVNYTEVNADADLDNLTFIGEASSAMDEVHSWRDQYGADLICLFENEPGTGGIGWLLSSTNGRPTYAFCLARVQQSDWTYTVVHEWGHNMGCSHSKMQTIQPWTGKLFSYSAGWQWDDTKASSVYPYTQRGYCTVMTYEDVDNDGSQDYERIGRFSNPDIHYTGNSTSPTGDAADGNNALAIRTMKTVLAKYRSFTLTVTFDAQGGTAANPATKSVTNGSTYGTLATTTRTGYTFSGWWTGTNGTGTSVTSSTTVTISSAQTLYAKWTASNTSQGTPCLWLDQHGLVTGGDYEAAALADTDGDGFSAWQEYIAGSNPTNKQSLFRVSSFYAKSVGAVIRWTAVSGRVYGVHRTTNLLNSFQSLETNIVWPQASYTDTVYDAETRSFYKVNVQLAE